MILALVRIVMWVRSRRIKTGGAEGVEAGFEYRVEEGVGAANQNSRREAE